jgi:hypothetical protein
MKSEMKRRSCCFPFLVVSCSLLCLLLSGCVGTIIGAAASGAVAVTSAVITAPIKIGKAVVDAASDDDEDEEDD